MTNDYRNKTEAELLFLQRDAKEASECAQAMGNAQAACKYLDQVNDASTELRRRKVAGCKQVMLTKEMRDLIVDALNDRDSKLLKRLEVCGPAERKKLLGEMGTHVALYESLK